LFQLVVVVGGVGGVAGVVGGAGHFDHDGGVVSLMTTGLQRFHQCARVLDARRRALEQARLTDVQLTSGVLDRNASRDPGPGRSTIHLATDSPRRTRC